MLRVTIVFLGCFLSGGNAFVAPGLSSRSRISTKSCRRPPQPEAIVGSSGAAGSSLHDKAELSVGGGSLSRLREREVRYNTKYFYVHDYRIFEHSWEHSSLRGVPRSWRQYFGSATLSLKNPVIPPHFQVGERGRIIINRILRIISHVMQYTRVMSQQLPNPTGDFRTRWFRPIHAMILIQICGHHG